MDKVKKISCGKYIYKGYILQNFGYYSEDKCIWWQAIDSFGNADFSANTKKDLIFEIDEYFDFIKI